MLVHVLVARAELERRHLLLQQQQQHRTFKDLRRHLLLPLTMLPYFENPTPYHHGLFMTGLSTVIVTRILSCPTARSSVLTMSSGGPEPSEHCV